MASFTVTGSDSTGKSLRSGETGLITAGGDLRPAGIAIAWDLTGAAGTATIDNGGNLASTGGRTIDTTGTATAAQSLSLINRAGATMGAGSDLIRVQRSLLGGAIDIDNAGSMSGGTARGINVQEYAQLGAFTYTGAAGATFQSTGDVIRLTSGTAGLGFTGNLLIDNAGSIRSTGIGNAGGQALDLNDVAPSTGTVRIVNRAGGTISAADADAIRTGARAVIDNYGTIRAENGQAPNVTGDASSNDAIDAQSNVGVVVNNFAGATIVGARHGITGDAPITVNNAGTITGADGAGINLDTAAASTTVIVNQIGGVIAGTSTGVADGDAIDVDGLVDLVNRGTISAATVSGSGALYEALAIGGGTVVNDGLIVATTRAITVDDSDLGAAFGALNLTNNAGGTIKAYQAIAITGDLADTIVNHGTIEGAVSTGGGNDTIIIDGALKGRLETGAGDDDITISGAGYILSGGFNDEFAAGAGIDSLTIDNSGQSGAYSNNTITADLGGAAFSGDYFGTTAGGTYFTGVEHLDITFSDDDNYANVDAAPIAAGATLKLDGGVGSDVLYVNYSKLTDTNFLVDANDVATAQGGTFAGFEQLYVSLGAGTNHVVAGTIGIGINNLYGGVDIVAGNGIGTDYFGYYAPTGAFSADLAGGVLSVSNGTTLTDVGIISLSLDGGAASFTTDGSTEYLDIGVGGGDDSLVIDLSGQSGSADPTLSYIFAGAVGGFDGTIYGTGTSRTFFTGIADLVVNLNDDDNQLELAPGAIVSGATLALDGGAGQDILRISGNSSIWSITADGSGGYVVARDTGSFALRDFELIRFDDKTIDFRPVLTGTTGADTLDEAGVYGRLVGGDGNDTYIVDHQNITITEYNNAGLGGVDVVRASVSLQLALNVEDLVLTGDAAIDGTGNVQANHLYGNDAANTLAGNNGDDIIVGNGGDDTLQGGNGIDRLYGGMGADVLNGNAGADRMDGGDGNDVYYVDDAGDAVVEWNNAGAGGNDKVYASLDYVLGNNVEQLTLLGTDAIDATGNNQANQIAGNAADNVLTGLRGNDTLYGLGGADTFVLSGPANNGLDRVMDFVSGSDHVGLRAADYGLPNAPLTPATFQVGSQATGSSGTFLFDETQHTLYWDADGAGGIAAVGLMQFQNSASLTAGDFVFI